MPNSNWSPVLKPKISAVAYGGLYCYVDILREPYQSYVDASRTHIGRGTINIGDKTYPALFDQDEDQMLMHGQTWHLPRPQKQGRLRLRM